MSTKTNGLIENVMKPFPGLENPNWEYWLNSFTSIFYQTYTIAKSNSAGRNICAPSHPLKLVQKELLKEINKKFKTHDLAFATKGQDYIQNALVHQEAVELFKLDIEEFYPNCTIKQILEVTASNTELQDFIKENIPLLFASTQPVDPKQKRFDLSHFSLPTGAPTSPIVANLALFELDEKLTALSKKLDASYTRYLDDITFSFQEELSPERKIMLEKQITRSVTEDNWKTNQLKTGWLNPNKDAFTVTGVDLRSQPKVTNRYIKENLRPVLNRSAIAIERIKTTYNVSAIRKIELDQFKNLSFLGFKTQGTLSYVKAISPDQYSLLRDYFFYRLEKATEIAASAISIDSCLNQEIPIPNIVYSYIVGAYYQSRYTLPLPISPEFWSQELLNKVSEMYFQLKDIGMYHRSAISWTAHFLLPTILMDNLEFREADNSNFSRLSLSASVKTLSDRLKIPYKLRVGL